VNRTIAFRRVAEAEYLRATVYYENERPGLGAEFQSEVQATLQKVLAHPDRYPIAARDIRVLPTDRFPYSVYYRVRGTRIVVISVFHESRDPAEWQSRS
jgi:toxin ParE1/3/4